MYTLGDAIAPERRRMGPFAYQFNGLVAVSSILPASMMLPDSLIRATCRVCRLRNAVVSRRSTECEVMATTACPPHSTPDVLSSKCSAICGVQSRALENRTLQGIHQTIGSKLHLAAKGPI